MLLNQECNYQSSRGMTEELHGNRFSLYVLLPADHCSCILVTCDIKNNGMTYLGNCSPKR